MPYNHNNSQPLNLMRISKLISLVLRHKPEEIGLTLDEHGWGNVEELLTKMQPRYDIDMATLEEIVRTNNKQRFSFDKTHTKIRANQGHSIEVDVELQEAVPPEILYHGTGEKSVVAIDEKGLLPMNRLHVHLSGDEETAIRVGKRHGKLVIYKVKSGEMSRDGYIFYLSVNNVWLTKEVPVKYFER
ncbi:RNA 2'-phosphotransferase [Veillonella seminalis]|uniref:Probable RNA 2'-phosphotransferase n=1 Tax=Veillonella seminalis ACS-216-V-Col6b TaxID=883156 RepID=K9D5K9_9FIRM|nr:RNA 2'-phosphotransferase [Veillonella seminalis]EKU78491.1 hypothetical protein HMPREF9282_01108 [Veillonella seminalis ACS-216-V-Col6b]